jgi:tetratricopeptide (TPR) repeat protein
VNYRSEFYALLSGTAFDANDLERARALLERALEYDPRSSDAHFRMGRVLLKESRPGEALAHFDAGLAESESHRALASRCRANLLLNRVEAAEADCAAALALDPNAALALLHQGDIYLQKGDLPSARRSWMRIRAQDGPAAKLAKSRLARLRGERTQEPTP